MIFTFYLISLNLFKVYYGQKTDTINMNIKTFNNVHFDYFGILFVILCEYWKYLKSEILTLRKFI